MTCRPSAALSGNVICGVRGVRPGVFGVDGPEPSRLERSPTLPPRGVIRADRGVISGDMPWVSITLPRGVTTFDERCEPRALPRGV